MSLRPTLIGLWMCLPLVGCPKGEPADAGVEPPSAIDGGTVDAGDDVTLDACARFVNLECDAGVPDGADAGACAAMRLDVVLSSDSVQLFPRPLDVEPCDCSENFVTEPGVCAQAWSDERECWCGSGEDVIYPRRLIDEATLTWPDGGATTLESDQRDRHPWLFGGSLWGYLEYEGLTGDAEVILRGCFGDERIPLPSFSPPTVIRLIEQTNDGGASTWLAELSDDSTLGHRCRGSEDPSCCGSTPDALVLDPTDTWGYNRVHAVRADVVSTTSFGEVRVWTRSDPTYPPE